MPPAKLARDDLKSLSSSYTLCEERSARYRGLQKFPANIADDGPSDGLPMLVLASLLIFEQSLPTLCVSGSIWKRLIHLAPYARDVLWCLLVMWRVWCIRGKNAPNIQI